MNKTTIYLFAYCYHEKFKTNFLFFYYFACIQHWWLISLIFIGGVHSFSLSISLLVMVFLEYKTFTLSLLSGTLSFILLHLRSKYFFTVIGLDAVYVRLVTVHESELTFFFYSLFFLFFHYKLGNMIINLAHNFKPQNITMGCHEKSLFY